MPSILCWQRHVTRRVSGIAETYTVSALHDVPVICTNWFDVRDFAQWLKSRTGRTANTQYLSAAHQTEEQGNELVHASVVSLK